MTIEDIPDWARDENDPPKHIREKKEEHEEPMDESPEPVEEDEVAETEDVPDDETEDAEDDTEDEDMGEPIDDEDIKDEVEDEDEEDQSEPVIDIDEDDNLPPSKDTISLDVLNQPQNPVVITVPQNPEKGTETPTEDEKPVKKRSRMSLKDWLNGTPDKPLPLFGMRARFKRWRLIHFHNHVWLRIMSYDKNTNEYTIREDLIHRSRLPRTAVHCTNEKTTYFDKLFEVPYEPWKDHGFGAMNAYLYMKDTSIDEALLLMWRGHKLDMKTLAIIGIIAIAGIFYLFYMMQG